MSRFSLIAAHPILFKLAVLTVAMVALYLAIVTVRSRYIRRITDPNQRRNFRRGINLTFFAVVLVSVAFTFSSNLTGLAVSLGVAGAAVAFALQEVLASGIAWVQIIAGRVYRAGDRVKMGGVTGDVIQINVFLTTLMEIRGDWVNGDQYTGRVVRVPNSAIYKNPIYNYNADFDYVWDELVVPIKYGSDRTLARQILSQAVQPIAAEATEKMRKEWDLLKESYAVEDAQLEPAVFLVANDNWLEYTVRYLVHYKKRRITKSDLCEAIVGQIEMHADKVGIASGTYDIVGLPQIKVMLEPEENKNA